MVVNFIHMSICFWRSSREMFLHDCEAMFVLQFQVQVVQEFSRFELPEMVQQLFHQELLQRLGIEGAFEKVCIPDIMEHIAHFRRPRQVEFLTPSQLKHDV